jgi:hypothetical protein
VWVCRAQMYVQHLKWEEIEEGFVTLAPDDLCNFNICLRWFDGLTWQELNAIQGKRSIF